MTETITFEEIVVPFLGEDYHSFTAEVEVVEIDESYDHAFGTRELIHREYRFLYFEEILSFDEEGEVTKHNPKEISKELSDFFINIIEEAEVETHHYC